MAAIAVLAQHAALAARSKWPLLEESVWVPSPRAARLISLGYNELFADCFWARTLVYYGEGLGKNISLADVEPLLRLVNWLDPRFRRPYQWGAHATMFRQRENLQLGPGTHRRTSSADDARASIEILERGLAEFPDDWEMAWLLGLRYFLDLPGKDEAETRRNKETGAGWIEHAMRMPGSSPRLPHLAASLRTRLGQHDQAAKELREMILTTEDREARAELERRYALLASKESGKMLAQAAEDFVREWHAALPFAPPELFVVLGPTPPRFLDFSAIAGGIRFEFESEEDLHMVPNGDD